MKIITNQPTWLNLIQPKTSRCQLAFLDQRPRPCIIICPGGGYQHLAVAKEGTAVASWLQGLGFHTGILFYQVVAIQPANFLRDLDQLMTALKHQPLITAVYVIGFSAGGHVAGLLSTTTSQRPQGTLLCYPVVSFDSTFTHEGSKKNFLGQTAPAEAFSLENLIDHQTPPIFLWHTAADQTVPCANSLCLAQALAGRQIPYELHVFPSGRHGLGLLAEEAHTFQWKHLAENWLKQQLADEGHQS